MAYTTEQLELKAYLEAQRDKTLAWVAEDPDNRVAATATTDLDHWAQWGITTVYQYQHHEAVTAVFEMHRDIWNFKPSWSDLEEMTLEELESELALAKNENRELIQANLLLAQRELEEARRKMKASQG